MVKDIKMMRIESEIKTILENDLVVTDSLMKNCGKNYKSKSIGLMIFYFSSDGFVFFYNLLLELFGVNIAENIPKDEIIRIVNKLYNPTNIKIILHD